MTSAVALRRPVPRLGLNRAEVALALGVSENTVSKMVEEGALPKPRTWHTRKIWMVAEIEAFMSEWPVDGGSDSGKDGGDYFEDAAA